MEDPESEWEIQEYPSSKEGETTMVKWVLNKGYWIGKNVVITGFAISSAPLILPPLVVFSAMGVAFSVPFGLVFASYACTNKLMSKLLPNPASPLMLEYYADEDEEEKEEGWEEDEFRRENVIREEKDEQLEDIKQGVECRFEFDESGDNYRQIEVGLLTNLDGDVDQKGYYTDEDEAGKEGEDEDDGLRRENVLQEEEDPMGDVEQGTEILFELDESRYGNGQEVEALMTSVDVDVDEKGCYTDEEEKKLEGDELRPENVVLEEGDEQTEDVKQGVECRFEFDEGGDGYRQIEVGLLTNLDGDVDKKGYHTDEDEDEAGKEGEDEDDELRRENVMQQEEEEPMGDVEQGTEIRFELDESRDGYGQEVEALMTNVEVDVDEKVYYTDEKEKELEDDELRRENVVQEEKDEQMEDIMHVIEIGFGLDDGSDDYRQYAGASITNVDENVDEKGCYTDENEEEKDWEDNEIKRENVLQVKKKEQVDDTKEGAEGRLRLDEGGDDYRQEREVLITNVHENVDEKSYYANENEDEKEGEDDVLRSKNVIKEEERVQMEDIKQGVKMRLGLDMAGDELRQTEEQSITNFGGGVDEQGYEEDVGEYLEGDDDTLEEERKREEPLVEMDRVVSLIDENNSNTREVDGLDVVTQEIKGYSGEEEVTEDEKEEIVKGSTGLLEKIRNEGRIDSADDAYYFPCEGASSGVFEEVRGVEITVPVIVKEINSQKLVEDGSKNEEPIGEMRQGENEENNFNSREVEGLDLVAREVLVDTDKDVLVDTDKDGRKTESEEKVMRGSMGSQEKTSGNTSNDGSEVAILRTKKEHLIHSNADAREIGDESGLDLFDDRNASTCRNTSMNYESLGGGDEAKENTANDHVDVLALHTFRWAPLDLNYATVASKTDTKVPSREDILDDEKIWEKIGTMKAIVGYKAPSQPTCIGELKALYMFTGVEPPASFKGDSDLDEVKAKLKFLMSIVGVK